MPKHTPGPWHIGKAGDDRLIYADSHRSADLAIVRDRGGESETTATASLIAAAPDLLAACRDALDNFYGEQYQSPRDRVVLDRLRDAIARATE